MGDAAELVRAQKDRLVASYNAGQGAAFAAEFAEDCVVMAPGKAPVTGRKAIEAMVAHYHKTGRVTIEASVLEVLPGGSDVIVDRGEFRLKDAEGQVKDELQWMMVNKKVGDKFLIYMDIYNNLK